MKQQIDLMTGEVPVFADQIPAEARNETQKVLAGAFAVAAFCIGSTLSPGLIAPKSETVTIIEMETPDVPRPRQAPKLANPYRTQKSAR